MTLKTNYLRAIVATYASVAIFAGFVAFIGWWKTRQVGLELFADILAIGGTFMSIGVCFMFVPQKISYDADGFSCKMALRKTRVFAWHQLVAYGNAYNVFLLKFEGEPTLQISNYGFRRKDWKEFVGLLASTFPEKKCSFWIGTVPMLRRR
jgi:Zn-dependent protease with chaperone function